MHSTCNQMQPRQGAKQCHSLWYAVKLKRQTGMTAVLEKYLAAACCKRQQPVWWWWWQPCVAATRSATARIELLTSTCKYTTAHTYHVHLLMMSTNAKSNNNINGKTRCCAVMRMQTIRRTWRNSQVVKVAHVVATLVLVVVVV